MILGVLLTAVAPWVLSQCILANERARARIEEYPAPNANEASKREYWLARYDHPWISTLNSLTDMALGRSSKEKVRIINSMGFIQKDAAKQSATLLRLKHGAVVEKLGVNGGWARVRSQNITGWMDETGWTDVVTGDRDVALQFLLGLCKQVFGIVLTTMGCFGILAPALIWLLQIGFWWTTFTAFAGSIASNLAMEALTAWRGPQDMWGVPALVATTLAAMMLSVVLMKAANAGSAGNR